MKSRRLPKTKREFEAQLKQAFLAGCNWGYCVEHTVNIAKQEELGADMYLGLVSNEIAFDQLQKLQEG